MALTQWLPVSRRGAGSYTINNIVVPVGVDTVRLQLDVNPADFDTPDKIVNTIIEASIDGGVNWIFQQSTNFIGSPTPPVTHGGLVGWFSAVNGISYYVGQNIRVRFETSGAAFRWGLLGEVLP